MKLLEVRQKYSAARRIFNSLLGVSSGDETLNLMVDVIPEVQDGKNVPLLLFNPLNPEIKIKILICRSYSSTTEVVRRS